MKKVVGIASMVLAMTSLAACSNKTAQPKSSSAQSSQVTKKKTANIVGTYQDGEKAAILFKKDGTGRYVSSENDLDAEFNWKKKNSTTFVLTINDRKENHRLTAKLNKNKLTLKGSENWKTESFKRVTGTKINLDDFFNKDKKTDSTSAVSSAASKNNSANANTKSNIAGDEGLFDIPADLQGTWYSADHFYDKDDTSINTITIGAHTISYKNKDESGTTIIHKMAKGFDFDDQKYTQNQDYLKATNNWGRSYLANLDGHRILNVRGWLQGAGDGSYYYLAQENGQTVLVSASGAGVWADGVYWKDEASAKKYANTIFSNIHYADGIQDNDDNDSDDE